MAKTTRKMHRYNPTEIEMQSLPRDTVCAACGKHLGDHSAFGLCPPRRKDGRIRKWNPMMGDRMNWWRSSGTKFTKES